MMRYYYFPGCSMAATAKGYQQSIDAVTRKIGMDLVTIPDWNCCGATAAHTMNEMMALALPARNLARAEADGGGMEIAVACAACYSRMQYSRHAVLTDEKKREEIEEITPAIEAAKAEGITGVVGPCPPDSVFSQALGGWYDIVVCMYHDQGHIPLKTVGFVYDREKQEWKAVEGVNVTLGLPIIRASVDHGTDFYHAGKGNGNELSLVNAIKYAVKMTGRAH